MTGAADNGRPLLSARAVGKQFGASVALEPTSLDVRAGETLALVGPNGAGKSTLLALLAGALEPSTGVVQRGRESLQVGWVPQRPGQYGRLSARENLALFARLERLPRAVAHARVDALLEVVQIAQPDRPSAELSAGNQQRLNIAIALLAEPDVLLLDEPTASLDAAQRRRLWELATGVRERGGAVVFATQSPDEPPRFADAVAALDAGRLVFHGTPAERAPEADASA